MDRKSFITFAPGLQHILRVYYILIRNKLLCSSLSATSFVACIFLGKAEAYPSEPPLESAPRVGF